jgi:hypothetical protein
MRVLSLGAGVQSSTLLLMAIHGEVEIDRAVFADTQWEPEAVYDWLGGLILAAGHAGIPVDVVTAGSLREDALNKPSSAWLPFHIRNTDGQGGMLKRQCTENYKLRPIRRQLRALGATRKEPVDLLIGISLDEFQRMRDSDVRYIRHHYPLVDRRMTRVACLGWLERHGYSAPPKSSCVGCPYRDNRSWRDIHDHRPDEWADAVQFDAAIRDTPRVKAQVYLHRSLVPLAEVDFRSKAEKSGQMDMFDAECLGVCGV